MVFGGLKGRPRRPTIVLVGSERDLHIECDGPVGLRKSQIDDWELSDSKNNQREHAQIVLSFGFAYSNHTSQIR